MTFGSRVPPHRLFEASSELRDEIVYLRDVPAMQLGGEVDVSTPVLPGADVLFAEVD